MFCFLASAEERALVEKGGGCFHPLGTNWAQALPPFQSDSKPGMLCWNDCRERERVRRLECDELRRRVRQQLENLGCISRVISADPADSCSGLKQTPELAAFAATLPPSTGSGLRTALTPRGSHQSN